MDLSIRALATFGTDARRLRDGKACCGRAMPGVRQRAALHRRGNRLLQTAMPCCSASETVVPTATVGGYWVEDVNLDGLVRYTGSGNDRDRLLHEHRWCE